MNDEDAKYQAVCGRDARFDGEFFFAVSTTGVFCRPSCPATTPKRRNVRFFRSAAAAQEAGFRACRRCRPDAVPGSAAWNVRGDLVGRAMRLIADGVVDREGVAGLARRLGYSARQVQRQLTAELGAGPIALARAQRAHTARVLLQTTGLPVTDVAFAAGFASVRQFNDTVRELYACTPRELRTGPVRTGPVRREAADGACRGAGRTPAGAPVPQSLRLRLAYRGPIATGELFDYLQRRAIPGIEEVTGERGDRRYRRTLRLPQGSGVAEVAERAGDGWLECVLRLGELRDLGTAAQRLRRLFDLDADPYTVGERLGADPVLARSVIARPGLRAPGAADPEELAVRAVLGQQVSVAAGRALGAALVAAYGEPLQAADGGLTRLFPTMDTLAAGTLEAVGMPEARRATLRALCEALAGGTVTLDPGADRDAAQAALLAVRGIGPWTAGYTRLRGLGDPDVLLTGDLVLRRALREAGVAPGDTGRWRPWRSYAMHHLWSGLGDHQATGADSTRTRDHQDDRGEDIG